MLFILLFRCTVALSGDTTLDQVINCEIYPSILMLLTHNIIDYKFLGVLRSLFPTVPIIGLTATATSSVCNDVQQMLNLKSCLVFKASFNRPNLFYEVQKLKNCCCN